MDNFRLTSDGGVSIGAEVAYQEGALSRYYDQPRVEISLEPGTRPDRGGGLVPLEHSYRLEPTAPGGTSLEVLKPDRQPAEQFGQGEGCIIALSADLSQPVADPLVRLQLYRVLEGEDIFIFGTNNARHGVRPEVLQDGVRCQVDIPRLELMPGEYYFAASVMEGIGDQAVLFKRGATFRIGATEADPRPGGRPPILDFSYALDHLEDPGTPTA